MEEKFLVTCKYCGHVFDLMDSNNCDVLPCNECSNAFCPSCFIERCGQSDFDSMMDACETYCPDCWPQYRPDITSRKAGETRIVWEENKPEINLEPALPVCQSIQLAAGEILEEITYHKKMMNHPAYKELVDRLYMAARQAALVSRLMGDEQTAEFTDGICEKLTERAGL